MTAKEVYPKLESLVVLLVLMVTFILVMVNTNKQVLVLVNTNKQDHGTLEQELH